MSMDMFLWITPMPPSRAMAMAMRYSVTVSIAALMTGMFRRTFFVRYVVRSTSAGRISLSAGTSNTSSKVRPSPMIRSEYCSFSSIRRSLSNMILLRTEIISRSNIPLQNYIKFSPHVNIFCSSQRSSAIASAPASSSSPGAA